MDFAPPIWEANHDHQCHCREAETAYPRTIQGRHFEAWLIIQDVSWYLRYPLSYGNVEDIRWLHDLFMASPSTLGEIADE
ncbi:hypothetical protein Bind_1565 [Beijerinckia indica subsp. indica ATCC 9039]|uniref:Transposase n=1 Tax=Beijerinckia indica subsp. indica (strain ATCC 9039 / DSM 1715 / NCIMB 8712) TaxID=395963 RepID=B2IBB3_BEII9|nr:hypothetical protein Bind_1565 [Beijerinckia indica subsp. indica ATCC 9039]